MPKLQANLLSVSKLMSNALKMQFNLNDCFIKTCDGEAITIAQLKGNFYEMNFKKVHRVDVANLMQSPMENL